jgi:hypothetical protein
VEEGPQADPELPRNRQVGAFPVDWHNQLALNLAKIVEK